MFTIEIAGIPIAVDNHFSFVERQCEAFSSDKPALFAISALREKMPAESTPPSAYAESQSIYRQIAYAMNEYDGFLLHAAVISVDGRGVAFTSRSGTGKTTRVRMWKKAMGSRIRIVNGDKPILRFVDGTLFAFGTPWMGKENMGENTCVPLEYVCFLERGEEAALYKLQTKEVLRRLSGQILFPEVEENMSHFMDLLEKFVDQTKFFLLICNMDKEDPEQIWEALNTASAALRPGVQLLSQLT